MLKVFFRSRCWGLRQGHEAAAVRILYVLHSEQPGVGRTLIRSWLAPLSSTGASSETKSQQSPDAVTLTAPCFYGLINSLFQTGFGWPRGNRAFNTSLSCVCACVCEMRHAGVKTLLRRLEESFSVFSHTEQTAALFSHTLIPRLSQHTHTQSLVWLCGTITRPFVLL